jgi:hypothetical protein
VDSVSRSSVPVGKSVRFFLWVGSEDFRVDGKGEGACVVPFFLSVGEGVGWLDSLSRSSLVGKFVGFSRPVGSKDFRVDGEGECASVVPVGEGVGWVDSVSMPSMVFGKSVGFSRSVGSKDFRLDGEGEANSIVPIFVLSLLLSSSSTGRSATGTAIPTTRIATIRAIHRTLEEDLPIALDDSETLGSSISQSLFVLFTKTSIGRAACIAICDTFVFYDDDSGCGSWRLELEW